MEPPYLENGGLDTDHHSVALFLRKSVFENAGFTDLAELSGAFADGSLKGFIIDINQPEPWIETFVPLKIVQKRPIKIPRYINAFSYSQINIL